jgi:hypothetical protein
MFLPQFEIIIISFIFRWASRSIHIKRTQLPSYALWTLNLAQASTSLVPVPDVSSRSPSISAKHVLDREPEAEKETEHADQGEMLYHSLL